MQNKFKVKPYAEFSDGASFQGSLTLGQTSLSEEDLKRVKSATATVQDVTFVGSGNEITFGSPNILPTGYITRVGGMGTEMGVKEENLLSTTKYSGNSTYFSFSDASSQQNSAGIVKLPAWGVVAGVILYKGSYVVPETIQFTTVLSDQQPLDGQTPTYGLIINGVPQEVVCGNSLTIQKGSTISEVCCFCYTDMVTWELPLPVIPMIIDYNLKTLIFKEAPTELPIAGDISTIIPGDWGTMGGESWSVEGNSLVMTEIWGVSSYVSGYLDFLINRTITEDCTLNFVEDAATLPMYYAIYGGKYSLTLTINGEQAAFDQSGVYKTIEIDQYGYMTSQDFYKFSKVLHAGDVVSLKMTFDNTEMNYWNYKFTTTTEKTGASYSLPIIPEVALGMDEHYYNYIDLENNFAGIIVNAIKFDGSEDEQWEFRKHYSYGWYNTATINVQLPDVRKMDASYVMAPHHSVEPSSNDGYGYYYSNGELTLFVPGYSEEITIEDFREMLSTRPFDILYLLPPEERRAIPLEGVEPIEANLKQSNIISCNIPAVCTVKYQIKE